MAPHSELNSIADSPPGIGRLLVLLLDRMLRRVPFARDDLIFHIFSFLIAHFQRAAVRANHFDFQLAIRAIELWVGGAVSKVVLIANVTANVMKNFRQFALEPGEVCASPGQPGEGIHFVVGLKVVYVAYRNPDAMRVTAAVGL